ncbi:GAF domain-containing protein [uncultured Alcanivorax sp.]|uniref:GAF domain-containing protein n=1 Tax=uncultured Alcanivorax sp. TaxID=191215 RepID=UPI00258339D3|nr:GAF domain-containing protein [uncultured Alcanivorax sp.]
MSLPPDFMHARVDAVRKKLNVQVCSLYQADSRRKSLEIVATSGLNQRVLGTTLTYSQGLTGKVARTRSTVVARDVQAHMDYFYVPGSDEEHFRSYLGIPLECDSVLYGVLVVQTRVKKTFFLKDIRELHNGGRDLLDALKLSVRWAG